jgi:hypothetical protein
MSAWTPSPPPDVTPEVFSAWRSPRFGDANPQRMDNPLWEWLIREPWSADAANEALDGPSSVDAGPMWCFQRFGRSTTMLADSVVVEIGGEHEDHYMPDFVIYNDLVVRTPDDVEIYGYPRSIFPPTDFHTATPTGGSIVLIGSLGYPEDRRVGETQVLTVECPGWAVLPVQCTGDPPGWISSHRAELEGTSAIKVTGGRVERGPDVSLVENIDDWILHLDGWRWERLTQRRWPRFEAYRQDGEKNHLFWLRQALSNKQIDWPSVEAAIAAREGQEAADRWAQRQRLAEADRLRTLNEQLGGEPRPDLLDSLYRPSVPHECIPEDEDEWGEVHRVRVEGVVVRYEEDMWRVQVTVEGELPEELVEVLRRDLTETLEALELSPITCRTIP